MIAAILVFSQTAQTANISDVTAESDQWLVAQVDSQKRVDGLAEEGRDTADQYRSTLRESEGLKLYLQQLRAQLKSQEEEMAVIRQESSELDRTNIVSVRRRHLDAVAS